MEVLGGFFFFWLLLLLFFFVLLRSFNLRRSSSWTDRTEQNQTRPNHKKKKEPMNTTDAFCDDLLEVQSLAARGVLYAVTENTRCSEEDGSGGSGGSGGSRGDGRSRQNRERATRRRRDRTRPRIGTFSPVCSIPSKTSTDESLRIFTSVDNPLYFVVPHPETVDGNGCNDDGSGLESSSSSSSSSAFPFASLPFPSRRCRLLSPSSDHAASRRGKKRKAGDDATRGSPHSCLAIVTPRFLHVAVARTALRRYRPGNAVCDAATWNKAVTWVFDGLREVNAAISKKTSQWHDTSDTGLWSRWHRRLSTTANFVSTASVARRRGRGGGGGKGGAAARAGKGRDLDGRDPEPVSPKMLRARHHLLKLMEDAVASKSFDGDPRIRRMHGRNALQAAVLVDPVTLSPAFDDDDDDDCAADADAVGASTSRAAIEDTYRLLCGLKRARTDADRATVRMHGVLHGQDAPRDDDDDVVEEKDPQKEEGEDKKKEEQEEGERRQRKTRKSTNRGIVPRKTGQGDRVALAALESAALCNAYADLREGAVESTEYRYCPRRCPLDRIAALAKTGFWKIDGRACPRIDDLGAFLLLRQDAYVVVHDSDVTPGRTVDEMRKRGFGAFLDLAVKRRMRRSSTERVNGDDDDDDDAERVYLVGRWKSTLSPSSRLRRKMQDLLDCVRECRAERNEKTVDRQRSLCRRRRRRRLCAAEWSICGTIPGDGGQTKRAALCVDFDAWKLPQLEELVRSFERRSLHKNNVGAWIAWCPASVEAATTSPSSPPQEWTADTDAGAAIAWFAKPR